MKENLELNQNFSKVESLFFKNLAFSKSKEITASHLVGSFSHQVKQPLSSVVMRIQLMEEMLRDGDFNKESFLKDFEIILQKLELTTDLITTFRSFFISSNNKSSLFCIKALIEKKLSIIENFLFENDIQVKFNDCQSVCISKIEEDYCQVFLNLIMALSEILILEKKQDKGFDRKVIHINLHKGENERSLLSFTLWSSILWEIEKDELFQLVYPKTQLEESTLFKLYLAKNISEKSLDGKIVVKKSSQQNNQEISIVLKA